MRVWGAIFRVYSVKGSRVSSGFIRSFGFRVDRGGGLQFRMLKLIFMGFCRLYRAAQDFTGSYSV